MIYGSLILSGMLSAMGATHSRVTGERIVTADGGFNASWQRHLACYRLTQSYLEEKTVLDLGCGTGHARHCLEPRRTVGVDIDHLCLLAQDRQTVRADMRKLPFRAHSFGSVMCIHAIEHVPDPERVVAETARVLGPGSTAVFVTPNRLTFGRPDEIIDPYHFIEFDAVQLGELCRPYFHSVRLYGIFGSPRYMEFFAQERRTLEQLLRKDPLKLRRLVPRRLRQVLYDRMLARARSAGSSPAAQFTAGDFELREDGLAHALDVAAVCRLSS